MADTKISSLLDASALTGAELIPIVQGGANKKTTAQDVADLAASPVTSVAGRTGAVILAVADIADSTVTGRAVVKAADAAAARTAIAAAASTHDHTGTYQPLATVLTNTTASFTTAQETKLGHISVTQAVDLDAIESRVNDLDAAVVLKGVWDASAGTFPGAGAAQAGWSYIVSVAGTVDGAAFAIGDRAIAIADNASTSTYAANWFKADYTDQVLSVCGRTGAVIIAAADISDSTSAGRAVLTAADAAAGRTAIGAEASGAASTAVSAHAAATDPHGDRAWASSQFAATGHNHSGTYDPAGTAAAAVAAHAGTGGTAHANAIAAGAAGFMSGADKTKLDGIAAGAQVNPASTDAVPEGSTNLYHTAARVRAAILTGLSTATNAVIDAADTVLSALGKLQAQISAHISSAITSSGHTMGTGKLLGRGTAGTGALEEITLGTNLSMSGTTLNAAGGAAGGATNLAYTASPTNGIVTSDTGNDATLSLADGTNAGLMAPAQYSKLAGIETGAQANTVTSVNTRTGAITLTSSDVGLGSVDNTADASKPVSTAQATAIGAAVTAHAAATDPHGDRAWASSQFAATGHNHSGTYDPAGTAAAAVAAHAGTGGTAHANAIAAGAAGFMSGADKTKLDGIAAGAQVNPASTDAVTEGSTNLYHTAARVLGQVLSGLSTAAGTVVTSAHTILEAIGFLQKQITDLPSATQTLTNKRFTPRVGSTTSSATPTINTDDVDIYKLTAQTVDITSFTTNLSGTPTDGQVLIIEITGTAARAITWGASFEASTVALPTTTVTTAMLAVGFIYNGVTSKWRCMGAV